MNKDLGFIDADRIENIRRVGEGVKLMVDAGLIVITAFGLRSDQSEKWFVAGWIWRPFFLKFLLIPLWPLKEERDVKGLYAKARLAIEKFYRDR